MLQNRSIRFTKCGSCEKQHSNVGPSRWKRVDFLAMACIKILQGHQPSQFRQSIVVDITAAAHNQRLQRMDLSDVAQRFIAASHSDKSDSGKNS